MKKLTRLLKQREHLDEIRRLLRQELFAKHRYICRPRAKNRSR
jgi:hypothetical protein